MPAGRPSKIHNTVTVPALEGIGPSRELPITEAIVLYISLGVYPTNAARACGITEPTLANWLAKGAEHAPDPDDPDVDEQTALDAVDPDLRIYVRFLSDVTRAEAEGLAWHERNVRIAAANSRDRDGRLSLEFLARRMPKTYSKRLEVKVERTDREPAAFDRDLTERAAETFAAIGVPEDVQGADVLPDLDEAPAK